MEQLIMPDRTENFIPTHVHKNGTKLMLKRLKENVGTFYEEHYSDFWYHKNFSNVCICLMENVKPITNKQLTLL